VNLLVHGGRPTADAFAATLFELAARDVLHVEEVGDSHAVRVRHDGRTHDLLPVERRVLHVCRSTGKGALVPFDELSIGVDDDVDRWWKDFRDEVVQEARAQGCVSRAFRTLAVIGVGLLAVLAAAALGYASTHDDDGAAQIVAVVAFGAFAIAGYLITDADPSDRLSRLGRERAREWRDVARELDESQGFRDVRAGGSIVWGEVLAYAAALAGAVLAAGVDTAFAMIATVVAAAGLGTLVVGVLDLISQPVGHEGVVVARRVDVPRLGPWTDLAPRSRYVAIDEGSGRRIRALRIFRNRFETLQVGDEVTLVATPHLGYVRQVFPL
jgi:hypothetical protein